MNTYTQIATKIVQEQEQLMGPVAWSEAGKVRGIHIDQAARVVDFEPGSDDKMTVDALVEQYGGLFGRAAREVCKEAVSALVADLQPADVPTTLR